MPSRPTRGAIAGFIIVLAVSCGTARAQAANLDEDCGGAAHITCNSALWCQTAGGKCGVDDAPGKCDKPIAFCMNVFRPVCGCNGKTYKNDCERQKAKAQLDHVGACPKEPAAKEPKAPKAPKAKAKAGKK